MKTWQLGIRATCAALLAGLCLSSNVVSAAGGVPGLAIGPTNETPATALSCAQPQLLTSRLLVEVEAERQQAAARIVREAVALLQQRVLAIELPGLEALRGHAPLSAELITAVDE